GSAAALIAVHGRGAWAAEQPSTSRGVELVPSQAGEDIFAYLGRTTGGFDAARYKQILGAANPFKEGDQIVGVAAADEACRSTARRLLAATRVEQIDSHPPLEDQLYRLLVQSIDRQAGAQTARLTFGELKQLLLRESESAIRAIMPGLSSDVIGCVVKLM